MGANRNNNPRHRSFVSAFTKVTADKKTTEGRQVRRLTAGINRNAESLLKLCDGEGGVEPQADDLKVGVFFFQEHGCGSELLLLRTFISRVSGAIVMGNNRNGDGFVLVDGDIDAGDYRIGMDRIGLLSQDAGRVR